MSDSIFLSESIPALAGRTFTCSCGRQHTIHTQKLVIAHGALQEVFNSDLAGTPFIVADTNTWPLAPQSWQTLPHYVLTHEPLEADEYTLGDLLIETASQPFDYLIALGSGTIGDSTRYIAHILHKPFINVCTAPSMDGAASCHSPLIHHSFKTTYPATAPYAIYFDLDIMAAAPQAMIAAGFADIEGKHVATLDWYLGHLATGEAYCPEICRLTMDAVERCEAACLGLADRDPNAIQNLAEALKLSSLAMQLNITSRPASGMEHLISHAWENYGIQHQEPSHLHGDKVGIGTLIACEVYHEFFKEKRIPETALNGIRYDIILAHWDELKEKADALYAKQDAIARRILKAGGPIYPSELHITPETIRYGFAHMTDGRPRVTIVHLIEKMGLQDEILRPICERWCLL